MKRNNTEVIIILCVCVRLLLIGDGLDMYIWKSEAICSMNFDHFFFVVVI